MALQDLTPELRTRLSAVERAVGWFVLLATLALLFGFGFYLYKSGEKRGWFIKRINYATSLNDAAGLKVGASITLAGFDIGQITRIDLNEPLAKNSVTVFFWIKDPYPGYIWLDSRVQLNQNPILGQSSLEITRGRTGAATAYQDPATKDWMVLKSRDAWLKYQELLLTNHLGPLEASNTLKKTIEADKSAYYAPRKAGKFDQTPSRDLRNYCFIALADTPTLTDRLGAVASQIEAALPNILDLTNKLNAVLTNAASAVARVDTTLADLHPVVTNLNQITGNLREPNGSLGNWILPTNINLQLQDTLSNASATLSASHSTVENVDTNFVAIAANLDDTLEHVSDITSNLAWQVRGNTNLVGSLGKIIVDTDDFVQGLKRHWLLRSAFKKKDVKK
jgi:ABC-type transporter Mla subunit MlaD